MKAQSSILITIVILLALAGIYSYFFSNQPQIYLNTTKNTTVSTILQPTTHGNIQEGNTISLNVPAVDNEGNGVVTIVKVETRPGSGRTLVDINSILFFVDTQNSIQTAKTVAANLTHARLSDIDLIYSIQTNASIIEGPSAGAALTIVTMAALEGKQLNHSVMITGTISPDGSVGPVGGIPAKAKAAKDVGANLFLVPKGQGSQTTYTPIQKCEQIGVITYCTTEYKATKIEITTDLGVNVREISKIEDALPYFGLS
jgi:uncharacterized protein